MGISIISYIDYTFKGKKVVVRNTLITLTLLVHSFQGMAQLAIIQDADGYTNVRADSSIQSNVLFQVLHGQVFRDDYDSQNPVTTKGWKPVTLSAGPTADNCYNPPGKSGYMHSSRVLLLEDIKSKLEPEISGDLVILESDSIKVTIVLEKVTNQPQASCILGSDQGYGLPTNKLSSLNVKVNNQPISIPPDATDYIYQVQKSTVRGYTHQNLILITSSTNSAAGYYQCVWVIKDGRYFKRFVYFGP